MQKEAVGKGSFFYYVVISQKYLLEQACVTCFEIAFQCL